MTDHRSDHLSVPSGGEPVEAEAGAWWFSPGVCLLIGLVVVIAVFTRTAPFAPGLFWDLLGARDLTHRLALLAPERLALWLEHSRAGLLGLRCLNHLLFLALMIVLLARASQAEEPLPGVIVVVLLGLGLVHLLDLRGLISALCMLLVLSPLRGNGLRDAVGGALVIPFAVASLAGLHPLLLLLPVVTTVFIREGFRGSLILCALGGMALNPDTFTGLLQLTPPPLAVRFAPAGDVQAMTLLAGILLLPNLLALPGISQRQLPMWFTYLVTGFLCLADPAFLPQLIVIGAFLLIEHLQAVSPMSASSRVVATVVLTVVLHCYLYLNPPGFSLNTGVRADIGAEALERLHLGEEIRIEARQAGELAWKYPLLSIDPELVALWREQRRHLLVRMRTADDVMLQPEPDAPAVGAGVAIPPIPLASDPLPTPRGPGPAPTGIPWPAESGSASTAAAAANAGDQAAASASPTDRSPVADPSPAVVPVEPSFAPPGSASVERP